MKEIRYNLLLLILVCCVTLPCMAKDLEVTDVKYTRNSIYSVLISHTEQKFAKEIESQFMAIPVPEKYNDHDLSVKVVHVDKKGDYTEDIHNFVNNNYIASHLISKWFDRNNLTGECSLDLIKSRGIYNATELDKELAARSTRGLAMLEDAGEQLIGNTFVLMNEINYVDKSKTSKGFGLGLRAIGQLASSFVPGASQLGDLTGSMIESIKGFKVKIHTRLYQLIWDDESASEFYNNYYSSVPDNDKVVAFENNRSKFKLKYIGDIVSKGGNTSFMGIKEEEPLLMIRKACQRALDENVADLAKKYDQFRVKAPILSTDGDIKVAIGMKEGLTPKSKFEVLEAEEKDGKTIYKRVGIIKPIEKKIWDNRFMALEEGAYGADFGYTSFKKESGKDFVPGMLVREID